jgi:hypothetical protein
MKNYNIFYAKEKAKTIADKDEKLQVDTNSSVPENAPVDGEVKEPKDAKEGAESKQEEKPLDNNDTISELQKQILENGLEGLEETAAGGNAGGAEGGVSLSAAAFEQGGHESNIRETYREVDPYGHPVDLNGLMGGSGISGSTTPPRDTTPPNEPKIEIDHPNGKVIITPDPLTTEGGDTTTINYTDDNGHNKSATYTKGSDGEWHLIGKDNFPHMPESSESGKITIPDEALKDNTEIISFSTDKVGNKSSEARDITPDITPPEVTIDKITLYDTDVRANDSVEKIRVTGHSDEKDGILKIYDKDDNLIYTGNTDSNGNFDVEIVTDKVAKFENVTARVTDKSNNTGSDTKDSGGYIEHFDKTAPKVTDIETFSTDKSTPADGISDETRITFKVDDPTVTAKVVIEGHEYDANSNGDGTWSVTVPGFKEGTIVDVIATDGAGNKGSASAKVGGIDHFDDVTPPNDPVVSATNDGGATITPTSDYRVGDKVIVSFSDEQGNSVVREYTKGSNNEWSDNNGHSSIGGVIKINEDEIKDFSTISAKGKDIAGNFSNEVTAVVGEDPIPDMSTTIITQTSARVSEGEVATYKIELPRSIRHDASFEFNIEHITTATEDLGKPRFSNGVRLSDDGTKVIVPAGVKEFNVEIDVLNDNIVESDEKFSLNFAGNSVTTTVVNTSTDVITNHGDTNLNFTGAEGTSHLTNYEVAPKTMDATYKITTENITASDSDYRVSVVPTEGVIDNGNGTITLKAGQTHFTLKTDYIADNLIETNKAETFKVKVVNTATGESIEGTKTINDIDNSNSVYVDGGDNSYTENGTNYGMNGNSAREGYTANFNVRLDKASDGEQRFSYETVKDGLIDIDTDHVTFTNGVKLSEDGHSVIVPAGVKDFTVSYNTTKNDLVDEDTAFTLKINGVSYDMRVLNYEETNINGPENGSVPSAVEGNKVVFNVDMGKAASYEKSYDYTQSLVDTSVADYKFDGTTPTGNAFWPTFTNGVRLSDDGKKIIVPAGVKNFQVIYDTLDDNIVENHTEEFHISIGTKTFMGAIYDNDTSSITNSTTGSTEIAVSAIEGRDITFDVNVSLGEVEQRFSYSLMDETANKRVDYDPKMEFTNGVKMSSDGRELIVPAGVSSFKITVHTIQDERVEEDETFSFYLGNTHVEATIVNDDVLNFRVEQPATEALNNGIGNTSDIVNGVKAGKDVVYKVSANGVFPEAREYDFSFDTTGSVFDKDHATFSNGVTYNKTTGKITIPSGVDSFNVTIPTIAGEYTDGNSIGINIYNTHVEPTRVIANNKVTFNSSVSGLEANGDEGSAVTFNVEMSQAFNKETSFDYEFNYGTTKPEDFANGKATPIFSNGVRLSDDGHSVIVPAGVKSWTMKYDTFDDHLSERDESFSFKIHTATARGTIVDNDAITHADIVGYDHTNGDVANGSDGIAMEGKTLTYDITLGGVDVDQRNYNVSFNYVGGANIYDINSITCETEGSAKVTFTRTSNTSGYFTVPAGVNSFKMLIKTNQDSTYEEDEVINFRILDANATATIVNDDPIPNAYIYTLQTAAVTEGQDLVYTAKTSFTTLKEQRFAYKLSLNGETNKDTDNPDMVVEPKFSNGVYLDKATNEIVVPKGTSEFTVTYKTIADGIIEVPNSDKVALTLGGTSAEATILNKDIPTADAEGGVGYENPTDETRGAIVYDKVTNKFSVDSTATATNEITYKFTLHGNFGAGVEDTLGFNVGNVRVPNNPWQGGLELAEYPFSFSKDGGQTWSRNSITDTWRDGDEVLVKVALRDSTPNELWRNNGDRLQNEGEAHPDVADQTYHGSEYARNGWLKEIPGRLTFGKLGYSVEAVGYKVDNDDMVYIAEKSDEAVNIDTKSGNDSIRISADLPNKDNHINSGDADDNIYVQGMNPDGSNIKLAGTIDGGLGSDQFSNDVYSRVELTDDLNLIGFSRATLYFKETTDKTIHLTQNETLGGSYGQYTLGGNLIGENGRLVMDNNTADTYYLDIGVLSKITHLEANGGWNSVRLFGSNKVGDITINSNNGGEFYTYGANNIVSGDISLTENSSRRYNFNMNGKNTVNGNINLNFTKEELDPNINWHWDIKYFTESYAKNVVIKGVNDNQKTDLHDVSITSGKNSMLAMDLNYLNVDGNLNVNSHGRNNFTFYNTMVTGNLNVASGDTDLAYAMYRDTSATNRNNYNWYNVTIKGDANVAMDGHSNYLYLERVSAEKGMNITGNNSDKDSAYIRGSKVDNSHISKFEDLTLDTKVDNLTADGLNTLAVYARGSNTVTNSTFKGSSAKTDRLTIDGHSLSNSRFEGFENITIYNATVDGTTTISNPDEHGTESKMFYTLSGATLRDFALKNSGDYIYAYGTNNFENVAHLEDHTFYLADRSVINVNSQDSSSGTIKFSANNNVTIKADDTLKELESVGALRISMEGFATTYINARESNIDSFHYNLDLAKGHNTWNRFGEVAYSSSLTLHDKHDIKLYGQGTDRYETINLYGNTTYVGDGNKATVDLDMKGGIDVIYVSDSVKVKDMNISMGAGNDSFVFYNKNASVVGSIIDGGLGEDGLSITGGSTSIGNEFKNFNSISIGKDARVEDTTFIADSEYRVTTVSIDSDHGFKNTTFVAGEGKEFNFTLSDYTKPSRTYDFAEDGGMFDHTGKANLNFNYGTTEIKNLHDGADKETNITFTAHDNTDKVVNSNFESLTLTDYNSKVGKVSVEGSTIKTVRGSDLADTLTLDEHSDITKSVSLGKGNDTITIKGNFSGESLDGGEGFDTLVVSKDLAWDKVSNFETLVLGEDNDHSSITLSADNVEGILKNSIINSYWSGGAKYNQINIVGDSTDHVTLKGYKLAENPSYAYNAKPTDMGESTLYESYNQATGVRTFVRVENDVNLDLQ